MSGRGAWKQRGFDFTNRNGYYMRGTPAAGLSLADLDHQAVCYGVRAMQHRINKIGYRPLLVEDGIFRIATMNAVIWAQRKLGITVDGIAGPQTAKALFWPAIIRIGGASAGIVGGICAHESAFDPGAVGEEDDHDLGLVQINGPANPTLTVAQRFDYHFAFQYATDRINAARATPGYDLDCAIASYGYPSVAAHWADTGTKTWPGHEALNDLALKYVAWIKDWMSKNPV